MITLETAPEATVVHKYIPKPMGPYVGRYLCQDKVVGEGWATNDNSRVTCPKCLRSLSVLILRAA